MSFVSEFAPDTRSQWHELDWDLQELIIDEMEYLAANPPGTYQEHVYRDFVHDAAGVRHNVFLRANVDHRRQRITIVGIVHITRPI